MTEDFRPFQDCQGQIDWQIRLEEDAEHCKLPTREVYRDYAFFIREDNTGEYRCFLDGTYGEEPYAVSTCDIKSRTVTIRYKPEDRWYFSDVRRCFSHACFEQMLIGKQRLILHASLVDTPYGGILFSGPSGVGKSTQANLWNRFEQCDVINGDRPILCNTAEGWYAYGSPYAGSSECYINRGTPIRAIFLLQQGQKCEIHPVRPSEAFRSLYAQTVINSWNEQYVTSACDMLQDLVHKVPVYRFACTPGRESIDAVKQLFA